MPLSRFYIPYPISSPSTTGKNIFLISRNPGQLKSKLHKIFNWLSAIALAADPVLWNSVQFGIKHLGALINIYTKS